MATDDVKALRTMIVRARAAAERGADKYPTIYAFTEILAALTPGCHEDQHVEHALLDAEAEAWGDCFVCGGDGHLSTAPGPCPVGCTDGRVRR